MECIKDERTALGLPNHIVGMTTEGRGRTLRGQITPFILLIGLISQTIMWTTFGWEDQYRTPIIKGWSICFYRGLLPNIASGQAII